MYKRIALYIVILIGLTVNAQTTVNLSGTVSNNAGKPIANAIVALVKQQVKDTTGADGAYKITDGNVSVLPLLIPRNKAIFMDKGILEFSLPHPSPVKVEIFDVKGNLLEKKLLQNAATGFYRFNINENSKAAKLLVIRASIGQDEATFCYLHLQNGKHMVNQSNISSTRVEKNRLAKITAVDDTLRTTPAGYKTKSMAITSYDQVLNITLDTSASGDVAPSAGCGKTTTLKGEQTVKITHGGNQRSYIIRLPEDYDLNTPYVLWFGIHCLGGSATMVADSKGYEFYGMWKFANPTGGKGTTIFISPEGLKSTLAGSALGWDNKNGTDVEFIRAILQKVKDELCIDTTRIFSEGFSMGGSMSYALACAMPSTFRAICMHSGGPMSGCDQSHRGPVAMFITHGTNDPACPYPKSSGAPQLADLAKRDGCTAMDISTVCKPVDSKPVCAEYEGCDPGYPCRACIFVGGHDYLGGGSTSNTWVDDSTWSWFKRFF